jgi:threonine 3-dehydrogenase
MTANMVKATGTQLGQSTKTMRCLVKENLNTDGFIYKTDYPQATFGSDEVKIKVLATGICGTDKSIYYSSQNEGISNEMRRYLAPGAAFQPIVIGHEFCGIVTEVGEAAQSISKSLPPELRVEVGDYIAAEAHIACGVCVPCRNGQEHVCTHVREKGIHENGCFAETISMPYKNVILLGKDGNTKLIPPRLGALLDAFGNAVHTIEEANVAGKRVAILGAGPLGLMATTLCRRFGAASIILTEAADTERRFTLGTKFGTNACFDVSKGSSKLYDYIHSTINDANGVDVVLEMSGAAYTDAFKLVRNGGTVVLLGLPKKPLEHFDIADGIIWKGVTVKGIFGRKMFSTWQSSLRLLLGDPFGLQQDLTQILGKEDYPLEKFEQAFANLVSGKELKLVFTP